MTVSNIRIDTESDATITELMAVLGSPDKLKAALAEFSKASKAAGKIKKQLASEKSDLVEFKEDQYQLT